MKKRDDEFLEPDLTPLIDVVFILLIFFLVTSVFKKEELSMILNLPKSESGETSNSKDTKKIVIEVKNNKYLLSGKEIQSSDLNKILKTFNSKRPVHIRSDRETPYYKVVDILDELRKNKFTEINLITVKEK